MIHLVNQFFVVLRFIDYYKTVNCSIHIYIKHRDHVNLLFFQNQQAASELARIAGEFAEGEAAGNSCSSKGDDLLAMMDDL